MVQDAAIGAPRVRPEIAELVRKAAEIGIDPPADWLAEVHRASLSSERMRPIAEDPVLAAAVRRATVSNIRHWAAANVQAPGERVPPNLGPETLATARDLVRRGLDETALDSYRTSYSPVWNRLMEICFALTQDQQDLRELLEITSWSITTFIEDTVEATSAQMQSEREELTRGSLAERRAVVTLLMEGAPVRRATAEAQLGYRLTGPHTAAVIWAPNDATDQLELAADAVATAAGTPQRLTVVATAGALWVWLPADTPLDATTVQRGLAGAPDVRVAIGRPGQDLDGFRRSHLDAQATLRMMTRLTSPQQVATYQDVQLVALITADPTQADEFLADTLGDLATADRDVIDAVAAYLQERGSTTRTADRLFTHRNTVLRRLARADELLPRPLAANPVAVGAALEVLRWRG